MLYQIYETQRSLMEPFAELALAASRMFTNPVLPFSHAPGANRMAAGYNLLHRLAKDYEKPRFEIESVDVDGAEVTIHERVEINKPFCELRRFKRYADDTETLEKLLRNPVVLIVAPLSGHYATLLRDTVRTMLKDHKVYITDWKNARNVPLSEGGFNLNDYVNYVQEFIRYLQKENGECHVVSVCQPTVPVLAAVSLMASRGEQTPATMTMMGGPVDASKSPTAVNDLAVQRSIEWFENNVIYRVPSGYPGEGRRVYPGFLQFAGFVAMNPNRHAASYYDYFKDLIRGDGESTEAHRKFYDEYNAVLDMDAEYYLDTIETVFQEFKLVNGTWDVKGVDGQIERVRPQDITKTAVLAIEGELDDIAGLGQTQASLSMCSGVPDSEKLYYEVKGAGHYGIFSGRRWREMAYPVLRDFILRHHSGIVTAKRRKASQPHLDDLAKRAELYEQLQLGQEASIVEPAPAVAEVATAEPVKAAPKARTAARKTAAKPASRAGSTRKTATKAAATEAPAAAEKAAPASASAAKAVTGTAPAKAAEKATAPATTAEAAPKAETVAAAPAAVAPAAATSKEAPQADAGKSAEVPPQQAADSAIAVQADAPTSKPMTTWRLPGSAAEEQTTDQAMADSQQS